MRRNASSSLRFPLLVYGEVNSRRESRNFLALLVSLRFKRSAGFDLSA